MAGKGPSRPQTASVSRIAEQAVREALARGLGPGNYGPKSIGMGTPADGAAAGPHNAVYAYVNLVNGAATYDVPHKLGSVPVHVELHSIEYPGTINFVPHAHVQPVRQSDWTTSMARVDVALIAGASLTGCVAKLIVRGA